jgi:ribosome maturation factor RimP
MQIVEPGKPPVPRLGGNSAGKARGGSSSRTPGKARRAKGGASRSPHSPGTPGNSALSLPAFHAFQLTPEIEAELAGIAAGSGCELLHVEWKGGVLRLILDRAATAPTTPMELAAPEAGSLDAAALQAPAAPVSAGVSLGDCEHVAKQASALLDVLDFGGGRYVLEVSSPGLDRQLYRPSDYQRFLGRLVRVTYEAAGAEGRTSRRTIVARLSEFAPPQVTLIDERTGERLTLRIESIRLARLEVEL